MHDRSAERDANSGLTLVELLVAVCLASLVLMGAWPWCWGMVRESSAASQRAEAESSLAFVGRLFSSEVRRAVGLAEGTGLGCGESSVSLLLRDAVTDRTEVVTYRYDSARGVLWRKSPSSYVAERVRACAFSYFGVDGRQIVPPHGGVLATGDLACVSAISLGVLIASGDGVCERTWVTALRVSGR